MAAEEEEIAERIEHVCNAAWEDFKTELCSVPLPLWNESVFRYFFVKQLRHACPDAKCQMEWNRFDLLLQIAGQNVLIEFKFYHPSIHRNLSGDRTHAKGGAGPKNFAEFTECISKLNKLAQAPWSRSERHPIHKALLVLVYAHHRSLKGKGIYRDWYDKFPEEHTIEGIEVNRLWSAPELRCEESDTDLFGRLFEINSEPYRSTGEALVSR